MNFLTALQADRLIAQIREEADPSSANGKKLFTKLGKLGTGAIPKILEALASADKRQTVEYVELLNSLISDKTLPLITRGLADGDPAHGRRARPGRCRATSATTSIGSSTCSARTSTRKPRIVEVLQAHKDRLNIRQLLAQIYFLQPSEKAAVFKLIDEVDDRGDGPRSAGAHGRQGSARQDAPDQRARALRPPGRQQGAAGSAARQQQARARRRARRHRALEDDRRRRARSPGCCSTPTSTS